MYDPFEGKTTGSAQTAALMPAENAVAITPADADMAVVCRAIYVGGAGTVVVKPVGSEGDASVTFVAVPAGTVLPIRATQIKGASTATGIVAIW